MANIRISDLPPDLTPNKNSKIALDGATTGGPTLEAAVLAGRPTASQAEAEAGTDPVKAMTPLTTKQALVAQGSALFATAAQGDKADTALQPADIGTTVQSYDAALSSLSGLSLVAGDVLYATGPDALARLPKGTSGQALSINIGETAPEWRTLAGTGDLIASNNLSDLVSSDVALANLGFSNFWKSLIGVASYAAAWLLLKINGSLPTRTLLKAVVPSAGMSIYLSEGARAGQFVWTIGDFAAQIAVDTAEGIYLKADTVAATVGAWVRVGTGKGYCVKWFGAVGDGVADDAPAIQAAITTSYARPRGGTVLMPAGTYRMRTRAVCPKTSGKSLILIGEGSATMVVFDPIGADAECFYVGSLSAPGGCGIYFRDFGISGPSSKRGIFLENANIFKADGVDFTGFDSGIVGSDSFFVQVDGCSFTTIVSNGLVFLNAAHGLRVRSCGMYGVGTCINLVGATVNVVIRDNDFETFGTLLNAVAGCSNIEFSGNYSEYCTYSYLYFSGLCYAVSIEDNFFYDTAAKEWTLNNIQGGSFKNNHLQNQTITVGSSVTDFDVGGHRLISSTVSALPWTTISSFSSSWAAGARTPGYRRNSSGDVFLRGEITGGSSGNVAFVLPSGFRPGQQMQFGTTGTAAVAVKVIVDSNGNVVPTPSSDSAAQLDGIRFSTS